MRSLVFVGMQAFWPSISMDCDPGAHDSMHFYGFFSVGAISIEGFRLSISDNWLFGWLVRDRNALFLIWEASLGSQEPFAAFWPLKYCTTRSGLWKRANDDISVRHFDGCVCRSV